MKRKVGSTSAKRTQDDERALVIDELGALQSAIASAEAALAPQKSREKELLALVDQWTEKTPAAQAVVFGGSQYSLMADARKNSRTLDTSALIAVVGQARFLTVATVSLENADKLIQEFPAAAGAITSERNGKRKVTTFVKAA